MDAGTAGALARLGITRYAQIAAWRRDDVRAVSQALGLTREVSRQNWIEQAALLERRKLDQRHRGEKVRERDIDLPDILASIRNDASARGDEQPLVVADEDATEALDEPVNVEAEAPQRWRSASRTAASRCRASLPCCDSRNCCSAFLCLAKVAHTDGGASPQ